MRFIRWFREVSLADAPLVGGKNASLGELLQKLGPLGVRVPDGFAVTTEAYRHFLRATDIEPALRATLAGATKADVDLGRRAERARQLVLAASLPREIEDEIGAAYRELSRASGADATDVAVRASAAAEGLPNATFAGRENCSLNVRGDTYVVAAVKKAFASLFLARAVGHGLDMGFDPLAVALSVGVQKMVRSDLASAGAIFTLDPETGHRGVVLVTSSHGLGESVVQGKGAADRFYVHKPTLAQGFRSIFRKKLGTKEVRLVHGTDAEREVRATSVSDEERARFSIGDDEVLELARWAVIIEDHESNARGAETPMEIEWAKDGKTGELFVVRARPQTVHASRPRPRVRLYDLKTTATPRLTGLAIGDGVAVGAARVIADPREVAGFKPGDVLIAEITGPDWEPIMKSAAAIVTERGGRTSHAAIVARELGIPAVVGATGALATLARAGSVTVSCAEGDVGRIYDGAIPFGIQVVDPHTIPRPRTRVMLEVGDPEQALELSLLPSAGVGLARMEVLASQPFAETTGSCVDRLSQSIATLAAAFWPRPVVVGFSERPDGEEGFLLELAAAKRVRDELGLTNLELMVPCCRSPEEARRVLAIMSDAGLRRGDRGLRFHMRIEIPSNVLLAGAFTELFDGFSMGWSDLRPPTRGADRGSSTAAPRFQKPDERTQRSCERSIDVAHAAGRKVDVCGEPLSGLGDFAAFLVEKGIDSISVSPDALVETTRRVLQIERRNGADGAAARIDGSDMAGSTAAAEV